MYDEKIYSLAVCPGIKYSGDDIVLRATPRDGIGPYYVAFTKDGIIINSSRLGGESNPITGAPEDVEIVRTYTLDDEDIRNAITGTIYFSVFIRGSCPTGGGLQFDGVNDYIDSGNDSSLNITEAITIEAWIKANPPSSDRSFITKTNSGGGYEVVSRGTGRIGFVGRDVSNNIIISLNSTVGVFDNSWKHVVITYDGTTVTHYANAIENGTVGTTNILVASNNSLLFGKDIIRGNRFFNGIIDEVRIYNRALSPTEILNNYNGYISRYGLVLEYIYSLGNANDQSGYGNNGTPINDPIFIPNACTDKCTIPIGCITPVCNFVVS
jgi:hypothetical protein